jgi:hypothetical protein
VRIDTILQESQILGHLKDSDAIRTIYGDYRTQRHSSICGDDMMASSTHFYTIKNPVTGSCTRQVEAMFNVFNIEDLGGKNNSQYQIDLIVKFGELRANAFAYMYISGGRAYKEWSHGGVKDVLRIIGLLHRGAGDLVVREVMDLFWGYWPDLWDESMAYRMGSPTIGRIIMGELEDGGDF